MSWTEVGASDEPVRGDIEAFVSAIAKWQAVNQSAVSVQSEFRSIVSGQIMVGFEGKSAESFVTVVEEMQHVLDDLPTVSEVMRSALDNHRVALEALKVEADQALARAKVAKAECTNASAAHQGCVDRSSSLQRQIDQLRTAPEPDEAQILNVDRLLHSARAEQNRRSNASIAFQAQLTAEMQKWGDLRTREDTLNGKTAKRLDSIDLLRLRDPNWIRQQIDSFAGFVAEMYTDLWKAGVALASGDLDGAMFHLRDYLDKVMTILNVVGLILDVVGVLLIVTGVGAGVGATLLAVSKGLKVITFVLALEKVRLTSVLINRGATNPETGEKLGYADLIFDGIGAGIAGIGAGIAGLGALGGKAIATTGPVKYNVGRAFVKDQIGISFKRGYEVAWKQTARNVVKISLTGSDFYGDAFSGYQGGDKSVLEITESVARDQGSDGGLWQGTSAEKARSDSIQQGISDIRAGHPGIVTPVTTNLVSF